MSVSGGWFYFYKAEMLPHMHGASAVVVRNVSIRKKAWSKTVPMYVFVPYPGAHSRGEAEANLSTVGAIFPLSLSKACVQGGTASVMVGLQ